MSGENKSPDNSDFNSELSEIKNNSLKRTHSRNITCEDNSSQDKTIDNHILEKTTNKLTFLSKLHVRGFFSFYFVSSVIIFAFSVSVYLISRMFPAFAEYWTRYPAYWLKFLLAKATIVFSFSVAEFLLLSLPVLIISYLILSWKAMNKAEKPADFYKWLLPLICIVLIIISLFFLAFGSAYFRYPLEKNLDIYKKEVSAQDLYDTAIKLTLEMEKELDYIEFRYGGASVCPYSYKELTKKINQAFKSYADKTDYIRSFYSYPKPIVFSEQLTYTHVSGVYTFITGEANINVNFPDYIKPYTIAHEMSHQRGIAREDEANFVAFLVCMESDDHYIRYSGYSNMLYHIRSSLSSADKELYIDYYINYCPEKLKGEFTAYSTFFDKYRNSTASNVTEKINNTFLNSQGQKEGTRSYGLVVDLTVAYYKNK